MGKIIDLTGKKFNRLVVIERAENNKFGSPCWRCLCKCGTEKIIQGSHLRSGGIKSCSRNCVDDPRKKPIKLNSEAVKVIRYCSVYGYTNEDLAKVYKIRSSTISHVITGRNWKSVVIPKTIAKRIRRRRNALHRARTTKKV